VACREAPSFEEYIRDRLDWRSEAGRMLAALSKDTSLSNAVSMAIESLSTRQSREFRHLVDLFEPYCEWVEDWESKGWDVKFSGSFMVTLSPPASRNWSDLTVRGGHPSDEVVAAAIGVSSVKFEDVEFEPQIKISYCVR
jgi:hypothetical protein